MGSRMADGRSLTVTHSLPYPIPSPPGGRPEGVRDGDGKEGYEVSVGNRDSEVNDRRQEV